METLLSGWSDFFVASAGCAGALVGLAFVAISINLSQIIELPGVAGRAAETIFLLSGTLAGSLIALIPRLSSRELGIALGITSGLTWLLPMSIQLGSLITRTYYKPWHAVMRFVLLNIATLPGIYASYAIVGQLHEPLLFFAFGVILSMLVAMFNAWILLVEIIR